MMWATLNPADSLRGPPSISPPSTSHVAARPAYVAQRRRNNSRNELAAKTRSYSNTITGAVTITSLQSIPNPHASTAATCQPRGRRASSPRTKAYSVSR